ncbi:MAG TPA: hotdog fold thioesterase [Flavobacteriaceae bacterium]|nr:hotdog fold thioesterase [Flavobacteriaceae bacterium]
MEYTEQELLDKVNARNKGTLMETLEIEFIEIKDDKIVARMPVGPRVHQPDGVLHGGATVALAETVGSFAAFLFLGNKDVQVRGIDIAANHVKGISEGYVYATATMLHKGRTLQLFDIPVTNEKGELISQVKLSTIALNKR